MALAAAAAVPTLENRAIKLHRNRYPGTLKLNTVGRLLASFPRSRHTEHSKIGYELDT